MEDAALSCDRDMQVLWRRATSEAYGIDAGAQTTYPYHPGPDR
jgi:hypothetical protein